jgi:hypothetical protein
MSVRIGVRLLGAAGGAAVAATGILVNVSPAGAETAIDNRRTIQVAQANRSGTQTQGTTSSRDEASGQRQASGQGQAGNQGNQDAWNYSASVVGYFDSFESDRVDGHQFSEFITLSAGRGNLWYEGDSLSFTVEVGSVQNRIERGGRKEDVYALPTDTQLSINYTNFDRKTRGVDTTLSFNLPTGKTRLKRGEESAVPNEDVVSASVRGEGFNAGLDVNYHWQQDALHYFIGGGYLFRSGYDATRDRAGDRLETGHELSARGGLDYQFTDNFNLGLETEYTALIEVGNDTGSVISVSVPATVTFDKTTIRAAYTFTHSTADTELVTDFYRRNIRGDQSRQRSESGSRGTFDQTSEDRRGTHHELGLDVSRDVSDTVALKALANGSVGSTPRPNDPDFYPTKSRYTVGGGVAWAIVPDKLVLDTTLRYFQVFAKDSTGGETKFSGVSAFASLTYAF